jgi:gliding motility-associated lipoprotein GldH
MLKKKDKHFSIFVLVLTLVFSCDSNVVFETYETLPNQWDKTKDVSFLIDAPDTTQAYNLYINLRNNNDYKFSNLFLITAFNYPNGKTYIDTLEYKMAAPNGELLGAGFSDVKENKLWYKGYDKPFKFTELGTYKMSIKQAMRQIGEVKGIDKLQGVTEVGFSVENK